RHPGVSGGAARRLHRQFHLVPLPELQEQDHRRLLPQRRAVSRESGFRWFGGPHLVPSVHYLQGGRLQDRRLRLCRLDGLYVQHDHFQHAAWHRPGRVERGEQSNQITPGSEPCRARRVVAHHRLRQQAQVRRIQTRLCATRRPSHLTISRITHHVSRITHHASRITLPPSLLSQLSTLNSPCL